MAELTQADMVWLDEVYGYASGDEHKIRSLLSFVRSQIASMIPAQYITSNHITAGQIVAKDFRTAPNIGLAGGPAGIAFNSTEIAGYSAGTTKEFYLTAASGKAYFGGGAVIADADGLHIIGTGTQYLLFENPATTVKGALFYDTGVLGLSAFGSDDLLLQGAGDVLLVAGGSLKIDGSAGASGSWTAGSGETVTCEKGIITSIV